MKLLEKYEILWLLIPTLSACSFWPSFSSVGNRLLRDVSNYGFEYYFCIYGFNNIHTSDPQLKFIFVAKTPISVLTNLCILPLDLIMK